MYSLNDWISLSVCKYIYNITSSVSRNVSSSCMCKSGVYFIIALVSHMKEQLLELGGNAKGQMIINCMLSGDAFWNVLHIKPGSPCKWETNLECIFFSSIQFPLHNIFTELFQHRKCSWNSLWLRPMSAIAYQITGILTFWSTACSDQQQKTYQSSVLLTFCDRTGDR